MAYTLDKITRHVTESARIQFRGAKMFGKRNKTALFTLAVVGAYFALASSAMAGTVTTDADDGTFGDVWETVKGWTQGTFGRIIALTLVLVGAAMGVVRQSLITFVVGIAMGLGLYNAPLIIDTIMGASIEDAAINLEAGVKMIGNGMK